jgi:hypothetical protein
MRTLRSILLAVALLPAFGAVTAQAAPRTLFFNLTAEAKERPERVFFQANSGPFLRDLAWTGWGAEGAVGTGSWQLDCTGGGSACGTDTGITTYPARYTLSDLAPCPRFGADATSYRRGVVEIDEPGGTRTVSFSPDHAFCAKAPTVAQARARITSYLRARGPAKKIRVTCDRVFGIDRECRVRFEQRGRKRARTYLVVGRLTGAPRLFQLGG